MWPVCFWLALAAVQAQAQSQRNGIGAIPYDGGVTFRVWAPEVSSVGVSGGFNSWRTTPLVKEAGTDLWSVDVAGAQHGQGYKFLLNGSIWKQDPRARQVVSSNPKENSIIYDHSRFDWGSTTNFQIPQNDLVIYEMHIGSFNGETWLPSTFDQCAEKIPYLKELGISAIQLMPVSEFPTDRSWGYNPSVLFAPESSFGGPDGFKRFVKAAHEAGMAVLLDVVHNHYGPTDLTLWQFNGKGGTTGGMYFYNDDRRYTDWGETRPNFDEAHVRDFIKANIRSWLEDYKVDGFRWDSVFNIRYAGGNWNEAGSAMLYEVNHFMASEYPNAFRIAEDHAFETGVEFQSQWDHGFLNDIRHMATTSSDSERNMSTLVQHLTSADFNQVVYVESHDSCGDLNNKHRLPRDIQPDNPQGYYAKKRSLLANAVALVSPAIPMIFMGSEFNEDWDFSNNHSLQWSSLAKTNQGIIQAYSDLIHLRRNTKGVSSGLKSLGNVSAPLVDNAKNIVGCRRGNDLYMLFNWSATAQSNYSITLPASGAWYCVFNSDSQNYDASFGHVGPRVNEVVSAGTGGSAKVSIGAYSLLIFSRKKLPMDSRVIFDPEVPTSCAAVTVSYDAADSVLENAAQVYAQAGINGWRSTNVFAMTFDGAGWALEYDIPDDTHTVNFRFTDGATLVDDNDGAEWALAVENCGNFPSTVTIQPTQPTGCEPVEITYEVNAGPLYDSPLDTVYLFIGRNGWQDIQTIPMTNSFSDTWTTTYSIPSDTWKIDFVFCDGPNGQLWDNNGENDWSCVIVDCMTLEEPYLSIANPPDASITLADYLPTISISGHAGNGVAHHALWTNAATGATGVVKVAQAWQAAIPLDYGTNAIQVMALNPNAGAQDEAANTPYVGTTGKSWLDGQNGGQQLSPWLLVKATSAAGHFLASQASENGALSWPYAWAMYAYDGKTAGAYRPFIAPLQPGDALNVSIEHGNINESGSIGFALQNRYGQSLLEYYFIGGEQSYTLKDAAGTTALNRSWRNSPQDIVFSLQDNHHYTLSIDSTFQTNGILAPSSYSRIERIHFWNFNAGGSSSNNYFIRTLSINGDPLKVPATTAQIQIIIPGVPPTEAEFAAVTIDENGHIILDMAHAYGLAGNVWGATGIAGNAWQWSLLPDEAYQIDDHTITIRPQFLDAHQIISIGHPGGQP